MVLAGLGANALVNLLISPLSTMHHWVSVFPLFVALAVAAWRHRDVAISAWLVVGLLLSGIPSWWYLGGAATWGRAAGIAGSLLVLWAAGTLVLLGHCYAAAVVMPTSALRGGSGDLGRRHNQRTARKASTGSGGW